MEGRWDKYFHFFSPVFTGREGEVTPCCHTTEAPADRVWSFADAPMWGKVFCGCCLSGSDSFETWLALLHQD